MSWLTSGLTQSVTGKITQLSGQLKDILTEGTEEVYDPNAELKVVNDKVKEHEKHIELLKMECSRWQEESNELNLKCQTFEAQFEQKQNEYRQTLIAKDSLIVDLRNQLNSLQNSKNESASPGYQKSVFMEEFEEVMPSSDLNDYIHLQKEIKRLRDDNLHLSNENKELLNKVKLKNVDENSQAFDMNMNSHNELLANQQNYEIIIENLKQEIYGLKNRLEMEKDKHQEEIIAIQNSYKDKVNLQLKENQYEIETLKSNINELNIELETLKKSSPSNQKPSENQNAWDVNDEVSIDLAEKDDKHYEKIINEKNDLIDQLKSKIEMFENELEQANGLISKLKNKNRLNSESPSKKTDLEETNKKLNELRQLNESLLNEKLTLENSLKDKENQKTLELNEKENELENLKREKCLELEEKEKELDSLRLEVKQQQQAIQHEKLMQLQEQKQERQELAKLKSENTELKIKLDEKLSEINLLGDQINELNNNINSLKSNDSALFNEFQLKTEQILNQLDTANQEIASLKTERDGLVEQRKQYEFVLDEKTRENSQLKLDLQKNIQHIAAQSKAIEKLQSDLKNNENEKLNVEIQTEQADQSSDELNLLKNQYNQIYTYLEQKNQESLSYYNEIQRLNLIISELNRELLNAKNLNENLNEQYDNLLKGFQLEQKMVDDLNQQTFELNNTLMSIKTDADSQKIETNIEKESEEKLKALVKKYEAKIEELNKQEENFVMKLNELSLKLSETENNYEGIIKTQTETFKANLKAEEQKNSKMSKELERLKEHLVEMSDNYNKDAIQAEEREKQLRLALNEAQTMLQQQGANLETSSKETEMKVEQLTQANQELKTEKEKIKEKLKQAEENYNHQTKVTKNLELVLERLQNEKDSQHTLELSRYQQTIKEQASKIHSLQKEAQNYEHEIQELKDVLETVSQLEAQLTKKEEDYKKLEAQFNTKDVLIETLEKRVNEIQKVNDSFIEKEIIKNLIIGYIKVNQQQEKKQVLKLIATMLNFNQIELETVENSTESKWFGLLKTSPNKSNTNKQGASTEGLNKSFAELLIQYVDRESKPKPNLQFDLNKKTDYPLNETSSSESAIKFFNSANSDLTLVNRNASSTAQTSQQSTNLISSNTNAISGLNSPAVANSFLEQILK